MELTRSQKLAFVSEIRPSEAGINEIIRVLLDAFSKQERALWVKEHPGEQCNGFRPRRWRGAGCSFELRIPCTRTGNFLPLILGILSSQESERALFFHELYTHGLSCEDIGVTCELIYGHHNDKQQIGFLSQTSKEEIYKWLSR